MSRLIFIALVVAFLFWLIKRALASGAPGKEDSPAVSAQGRLVSCAHCGVNLPESEARRDGDLHYCSEEHRRLGPRDD